MQLIATESEAVEISANLKEHNAIKYKKQSVLTIIELEFLTIDPLDRFN